MEKNPTVVAPVSTPLLTALHKVIALLMEARKELDPHLVALTDEERKGLPPVPVALPRVGAGILQAAAAKPVLEQIVADFDSDLVARNLAEATALATLANQLESLGRAVGDTRNTGLAKAYRSLLALYAVAKPLAEGDVSFDPIARPLANLFEERNAPKGKAKAEPAAEVKAEPESKPAS